MYKITILGLGGQGVFTLAKLISNAFIDKKYHSFIEFNYGKSIQNSLVQANIIISENKINQKFVEISNYLILLNNNLSDYSKYINDKTIIIKADNTEIINIIEKFGDRVFLNTYFLGLFVKMIGILSDNNIKKSIKTIFLGKDFSIINKNYKVYLEGKI